MRLVILCCALVSGTSAVGAQTLTANDRAEIINSAATVLRERYVDAKVGEQLARELPAASRKWGTSDPKQFATAMTEWLRHRSGDGHLGLSYSASAIEENGETGFSAIEMERFYGPQVNHGVQRIERLEGNIMLLELSVFPPAAMGADVIAAAMNVVAQGDALILDLRRNGGGAESANFITGYLLDKGNQPLSGTYNRPSGVARTNTSPAWVPGRRFGGRKPLYILTSKRTFSAAEAVAYDLQALGRAIIVGERTGGGAHPFEYRRVHRHFAMDLPEGRSINPLTGSNWQGVGVKPDVEVKEAEALQRAVELARRALDDDKAS